MANKVIEPSYQTLSDLAELFGSCVYQAPAMQQSEKLNEAVLPKENKIFTGITTAKNPLSVQLDNGQTVKVRNITGQEFDFNNEVMVMQNTSGEYILFAGGGTDVSYKYCDYTKNSPNFSFNVVPLNTTPNNQINYDAYRFIAFDTNKLISMINELRNAIEVLMNHFDTHTHTVSEGVTAIPSNPIEPTVDIRNGMNQAQRELVGSETNLFSVKYPK